MNNIEVTTCLFLNTKTQRLRNSFDSSEIDYFIGQIEYTCYEGGGCTPKGHEIVEVNQEELLKIQGFRIAKRKADGTWIEGASKKEQETIAEAIKAQTPEEITSSSSQADQITQLQLVVANLMQEVERLGGNVEPVPVSAIQAELIIKEELDIRDIPESEQAVVQATVDELLGH